MEYPELKVIATQKQKSPTGDRFPLKIDLDKVKQEQRPLLKTAMNFHVPTKNYAQKNKRLMLETKT